MPVLETAENNFSQHPVEYHVELEILGPDWTNRSEQKTHPVLFPFQERAISRISGKEAAILSATTGIGKTYMAIASANQALASHETERVLVLTHSVLTALWAREISVLAPNDDVEVITGPLGQRDHVYMTSRANWVIVPYSLLVNDVEILTHLATSSYLVIDSVSQVANPQSKRAVATKALARVAPRRLGLMPPSNRWDFPQWEELLTLVLGPRGDRTALVHAAASASRTPAPDPSVLTIA
jgi:superfamily II DNA or RNA helicase